MSNTININDKITNLLAQKRLTESVDPEVLALFREANKLGIGLVSFDFSGSGDSGDLNDISFEDQEGNDFASKTYEKVEDLGSESYTYESKPNPAWTKDHDEFDSKMRQFFDDYVTDRIGWDWYNNEGGGGTAKVNFTNGQVEISGYYYTQADADGTEFNMLGEENE